MHEINFYMNFNYFFFFFYSFDIQIYLEYIPNFTLSNFRIFNIGFNIFFEYLLKAAVIYTRCPI